MAIQNPIDVISGPEWETLVKLFIRFEGPFDPRSREVREAKKEFHALVITIFWSRVDPMFSHDPTLKGQFTSGWFLRAVRVGCRSRSPNKFLCP